MVEIVEKMHDEENLHLMLIMLMLMMKVNQPKEIDELL